MEKNEKELREKVFDELKRLNLKCGNPWIFGQKNDFVQNLLKRHKTVFEETIQRMIKECYFTIREPNYDYTLNLFLTEKCENEVYK